MSLRVHSVTLKDYRGYKELHVGDLANLVVITGPNAAGKTNIVEALQLVTCGESFRKPTASELVSWGRDAALVAVELVGDKRCVEHELRVVDGQREFRVNGKKKSAAALRGTCPSVLFIPDDLQMVKAASVRRRDALDSLAVQLSPQYAKLKNEYAKTLKQRNLLLREEMGYGPLFESWNESLVVNGSRLYANRFRLFVRLAAHMRKIYGEVVPGEDFDVAYVPSWNRFDANGRQISDVSATFEIEPVADMELADVQKTMEAALARLSPVEQQRKTSLVGPHKDEVVFFVNGRNARLFASQGQQRTLVLVWKLAEVELMREVLGIEPVLLLDDVMSELDGAHREALTWFIEQSAQTFITTTNLGYFSPALLDQAQLLELPIPGVRYSY